MCVFTLPEEIIKHEYFFRNGRFMIFRFCSSVNSQWTCCGHADDSTVFMYAKHSIELMHFSKYTNGRMIDRFYSAL